MLEVLRIPELAHKIIPGIWSAAMIRACSRELRGIVTPPPRQSDQDATAGILRWRRGAFVRCGSYTYQKTAPGEIVLCDGGCPYDLRCIFTGSAPPAFTSGCHMSYPAAQRRILREIFGNEIKISIKSERTPWSRYTFYTITVAAKVWAPVVRPMTIVVPPAHFAEIAAGSRTVVPRPGGGKIPAAVTIVCSGTYARAYVNVKFVAHYDNLRQFLFCEGGGRDEYPAFRRKYTPATAVHFYPPVNQ